ncbi:hypothetical protein HN858_02815 [Candidatus Falkowbacteria bacterium]|jgi:hypothetical protein|nr:hypothetical protein [Candidatus Falkowbacteria bacterium]MBT5503419.1 hypothetical protein [Candidatus Falkowbacteria bacterium]MBT6574018.1 hypothetical protein [Candidatus Falkowbacteria bacterium]MBT7348588.1 hypothetical protein [Candidatus Falkowbacteria bacterium]MBT7500378.1 hypothetical protein [Candidatus Falkowbacteria bacterium]
MKKLFVILTLCSLLVMPTMTMAMDVDLTKTTAKGLTDFQTQAGYASSDKNLVEIVGNVVKIVLTLLGVVVLVIIIYAGFLWMTAGGNEDQVKKSKQWLINAVIGLALILAAYAISSFVVQNLASATTK